MYLGYYGDAKNPSRGQLRVDADLARNGDWDVKKTYNITDGGYREAHKLIDTWGTDGQKWALDHNCGDFAEAVARIAGVQLGALPKVLGVITPERWGLYLRTLEHMEVQSILDRRTLLACGRSHGGTQTSAQLGYYKSDQTTW